VGLVIERKRDDNEMDGFQWYCENCGNKLHEEFVKLTDIVAQLPPIFEKFWGDTDKRTCKKCGTVMQPPEKK
jgi:3-hydroxyanthranilate 3,4-dioxygenase